MVQLERPRIASLLNLLIRRHEPLVAAPPLGALIPSEDMAALDEALLMEDAPRSTWAADLRFFLCCYVAGVIFFWIILS